MKISLTGKMLAPVVQECKLISVVNMRVYLEPKSVTVSMIIKQINLKICFDPG